MENNDQDFIIMKAGYNQAINDILELVDDDVLKEKILRKQRAFLLGNREYECKISKYYLKQENIGYVIFDDLYELKGICLNLNNNEIINMPEDEIIKTRKILEPNETYTYKNRDLANFNYNNIIKPFQ